MSYTYVDLFAGAGGITCGFKQEKFKNIFAVEIEKNYAKTYKRNFPKHNLIIDDIKNIDDKQIIKLCKGYDVDVVVGGPPCQGFSKAGNIGRTFLDDERNALFKEFVRFVDVIKPKIFIMENVAAMATHLKGKTINDIVLEFEKAGNGYDVCWEVKNSSDYGVPQDRRRILVVGTRKDLDMKFNFPEKKGLKMSVRQAIEDLPKLDNGGISSIPNHFAMKHTEQMLEKMSYVKNGGSRNDIPESLRPKSGDIRKYIRYNSEKPSVCITGDMRKVFHYEQNRALTPRELARIQTFPDDFVFEGTSIQIQQQIGNAVPVKLARQIAKKVKEILDEC